MLFFFNTKSSPRSDRKGLRSGGCEMMILSSGLIVFGMCSDRLSIGGRNSGFPRWNLDLRILWQAQYLVKLGGGSCCSARWKWCFICDADHWWHWFCVAGAVFGEVGGWLLLLRALEMMFHMWCGSLMTFILCGRRSIWWRWSVTFLGRRSTSSHFGR